MFNKDPGKTDQRTSEPTAETANDQATDVESRIIAPTLTERMRGRPLLSLGLAGFAGFVIGGGVSSRTGAAALMLIARMWLKQAAIDALVSATANYGTAKRNGSG